jgi:hypothetical protein
MASMNTETNPPSTWWDKVSQWVAAGKTIQTAVGIVIAVGVALWGAYQYFAKTYELNALRDQQKAELKVLRDDQEKVAVGLSCQLAAQWMLSSRLADAHLQTREALSELRMVSRVDQLPATIKASVEKIDHALEVYNKERDVITQKKMQIGGTLCGS